MDTGGSGNITQSVTTTPTISLKSAGSEAYYKTQTEKLDKENKQLKSKLDTLEKENKELKKSLYELSFRYDQLCHQLKSPKPFDLDSIDSKDQENDSSSNATTTQTTPPATTGPSIMVNSTILKKKSDTNLFCKSTLKGHSAAIYAVKFSPCGRYVASGSFDKTVRIWDVDPKPENQSQQLACFQEHQLNISEVEWWKDSTELLSASYDRTVKIWDMQKSKLKSSHEVSGFAQTACWNPTDNNIIFVGTTQKQILVLDRRLNSPVMVLENDAMINTVFACKDGLHLISGDAFGAVKMWDLKRGTCRISQPIDDQKKPISHVHVSDSQPDEEGKYLAVNCYDNVLRVYNARDSSISSQNQNPRFSLLYSLTGHKNKNYPIKSSFLQSNDVQLMKTFDVQDSEEGESGSNNDLFVLATGSADSNAYVYTVKRSTVATQKLEGHSDRVFCVHFHPASRLLATCSADATIKLWS